jgi:hypothetical protein
VPQTGTLTMIRHSNGKYHFYYRSSPKEDLVLDYQLGAELIKDNKNKEVTDKPEWKETKISFSGIDVFSEFEEIDKLFDNIEKELSMMDNRASDIYAKFMRESFTTVERPVIEEKDYNNAFYNLKRILTHEKNNFADPMYNNLRAKLEGDLTLEEKIMIVDRFKSIFSYHPNISENGGLKTNNGKVLQKIVADRDKSAKNVYEKLH